MPYKETENGVRVTSLPGLKRLWGKHREIIRLHAMGTYTMKEIAKILGISAQTVSNTLASPLAERELLRIARMRDVTYEDLRDRINAIAPMALDIIEEDMLDPETPKPLRTALANKILDRAGHSPVVRAEVSTLNATVTPEFMAQVRARAEELRLEKQKAEESSYEEVN